MGCGTSPPLRASLPKDMLRDKPPAKARYSAYYLRRVLLMAATLSVQKQACAVQEHTITLDI